MKIAQLSIEIISYTTNISVINTEKYFIAEKKIHVFYNY